MSNEEFDYLISIVFWSETTNKNFSNQRIKILICFFRMDTPHNAKEEQNQKDLHYLSLGLLTIKDEQDYQKSKYFFERSYELGNSLAACYLGVLYLNGLGGEANPSKALSYFYDSIEKGNENALCQVGRMYENGLGVEKSLEKAIEYYKKASEKGNDDAHVYLAKLYLVGNGLEQNLEIAKDLLEKASSKGNDEAMYLLGNLYEKENNFQKAQTCYEKAVELENEEVKFD